MIARTIRKIRKLQSKYGEKELDDQFLSFAKGETVDIQADDAGRPWSEARAMKEVNEETRMLIKDLAL